MTRVHVTLRVPGTMPLPALLTLIKNVEAAGFDGVGILDSQLLCRDTFVTLGLAAVDTSRRALLAGQAVDFGTTSGRLAYASGRHIPVLMAASGPKAIELAGEIADGVMLSVGFHCGIVDAVLGHLAEGARRGSSR